MVSEKEWYRKISERILFLMGRKKMSKEELAKQSGLSDEIIAKWLNADFEERWITDLVSISKALSVQPDEIFSAIAVEKPEHQ
ncbi:MAG: helix-turn-helix transcriptional regulator [Ruminococcus flavefaciens]|nr:helix-turn-helix transcriptional regulator [Ruminococcus flavefaciens]